MFLETISAWQPDVLSGFKRHDSFTPITEHYSAEWCIKNLNTPIKTALFNVNNSDMWKYVVLIDLCLVWHYLVRVLV